MASATTGGTGGAVGRNASARTRLPCGARRGSRANVTLVFVVGESERCRRRLQLAALVHDLDAALGFFEARVTEARQLHAALVELERFLEREVAFFELLDDAFRARRWPLRSL